jgi:Zn finger protein HypA/HybF involved in hydrogenase expression
MLILPEAGRAFKTGLEQLKRGNKARAWEAFSRAIAAQPGFIDAHWQMAQIAEDQATKRKHLNAILRINPHHLEALRYLMVIDKGLSPEQARRLARDDRPQTKEAQRAVSADAIELLCPQCGGQLTLNTNAAGLECRFCGFQYRQAQPAPVRNHLLAQSLLELKALSGRWKVDERKVRCEQCGAEQIVPAKRLSAHCRFCGSTKVILGDSLASLRLPDGIIPYLTRRRPDQSAQTA